MGRRGACNSEKWRRGHVEQGGDGGPRRAVDLPKGEVELGVGVETTLLSCAGCGARCGKWAAGIGCVPSSSYSERGWSGCSGRKAAHT